MAAYHGTQIEFLFVVKIVSCLMFGCVVAALV
jgi:hypothetical protein